MTFAKSILMGTGSVALAGLVLVLLSPKAAHAIVATAVQVMNTTANPVPNKDVDQPGRNVFHQTCLSTTNTCTLSPAVPSGHIFVVQTISADVGSSAALTAPPIFFFNATSNGDILDYFVPLTLHGNGTHAGLLLPTTLYEDPMSPLPAVSIGSPTITGTSVALIGYLISTP